LFGWRASQSAVLDRATRMAWRVIAAGTVCWFCGELLWFYFDVIRGTQPFPSWADAGYLSFYPLVFVGLVLFPVTPRGRSDRATLWLDTLTVMLGSGIVVWYLVIGPTIARTQHSGLAEVLSLAYGAGDLILIYGVARILLRRPSPRTSQSLRWMVVGLVLLASADVVYARLSLSNNYAAGTLPDGLWLTALVLVLVAAHVQRLSAQSMRTDPEPVLVPSISKVPYLAVVGAFAVLIFEGPVRGEPLALLIMGVAVLTLVVLIRQITAVRENQRLLIELDRLAGTDLLTGLANRRGW
jgi:hypothetical protein